MQSQYFDWDNSDYMPTPPGYTIYVPWYVGATGSINSTYDVDVYSDHKASDGWEMLYSNFSSTVYTQRPFFILYNKYRGLMRIYHYNDNAILTTSSKVLAGINWAGNGVGGNKVLNYLESSTVDVLSSKTSYYAIETSPKNSAELPVSPYKWYMLQYEMAYDPSIVPTTSQTPPTLSWYMNFNNITQFSLSGSLISRSPGKAGSSSLSDAYIDSQLGGVVRTIGSVAYDAIGKDNFSSLNPGISTSYYNLMKQGWINALGGLTGGWGRVANFLSGILGGSSNGTTGMMKIDATLKLNGTSTSNGSLFAGTTIYMPGSLAKKVDGTYYVTTGLLPVYNSNLGVFNLSSTPVVPVLSESEYIDDSYPEPVLIQEARIGFIDNSDKIVYNPAVLAIATVQVVQQDVIIFPLSMNPGGDGNQEISSSTGGMVYVNPTFISGFYTLDYRKAVRFVIKVTPNNSNIPPSYIVKTFVAD